MDAYKEEMISLGYNLYRKNYPERITSTSRNLDRKIEDENWKLTTVCLHCVKALDESIQRICFPYSIKTIFTSRSNLRRYLFRVKLPTEFNIIKSCVYSIRYSWVYEGERYRPLKIRLEERRKAVVWGEIEKSGMADHIWKEKGNHLPL